MSWNITSFDTACSNGFCEVAQGLINIKGGRLEEQLFLLHQTTVSCRQIWFGAGCQRLPKLVCTEFSQGRCDYSFTKCYRGVKLTPSHTGFISQHYIHTTDSRSIHIHWLVWAFVLASLSEFYCITVVCLHWEQITYHPLRSLTWRYKDCVPQEGINQ